MIRYEWEAGLPGDGWVLIFYLLKSISFVHYGVNLLQFWLLNIKDEVSNGEKMPVFFYLHLTEEVTFIILLSMFVYVVNESYKMELKYLLIFQQ